MLELIKGGSKMDKSVFFLVIAVALVWLVLNELYGNQIISKFITMIIPKAED